MKESKPKVIYVLAASHSGSTLLSLLLGLHPDVCTVGELKLSSLDDKERYLCSCGARIRECYFWQQVSNKMKQQSIDFDVTDAHTSFSDIDSKYCQNLLAPLHRGPILELIRDVGLFLSPAWREHIKIVQRRNTALITSVLDVTKKKIIVDSSKVGLRLKYLLRNPELDMKVIRLVRDGRAVSLTYIDTLEFADAMDPSLRRGGLGDNAQHNLISMEEAAYRWLRSNEEAEVILCRMSHGKWTQVRYEDYCTDPRAELSRLFRFIGVDPEKWPWPNVNTEYHVVGNGMRLDWDGSVTLDERWKKALTQQDLKVFDEIAGAMNRKLGYQ